MLPPDRVRHISSVASMVAVGNSSMYHQLKNSQVGNPGIGGKEDANSQEQEQKQKQGTEHPLGHISGSIELWRRSSTESRCG